MNKRDALLLTIPILLVFVLMVSNVTVRAYNIYNDTVPPVITLNGNSVVNVPLGGKYIEPNATAHDNWDGDITYKILITGYVDTNTAGIYTIQYIVADALGNFAKVNRTVNVVPSNAIPAVTTTVNTANTSNNTVPASNNASSATAVPSAPVDSANPFAGAAAANTASTPITGGAIGALTSTGGIIGMVAFAFVLIMTIIIVRARKKYNKKIQESVSSTLAEGNKKI